MSSVFIPDDIFKYKTDDYSYDFLLISNQHTNLYINLILNQSGKTQFNLSSSI